ncbi:hypothetical protein [Actinocrispum wychmicini]|uniref:Uncharacterized protein n=1 Tax=Actinocrispum wychmicini TaxID=1213861 RepID=A0A4R2IYI4_9PSEU|nr:hypothetical protein [Actinocrispum wychmicini]TCO47985.1 hypothetical protein EV192_11638 [Actinocrispum wychmicini]
MSSKSPAQEPGEPESDASESLPIEADMSDSALLEHALQAAVDAHAAGLLAAPFGVDETALKRARRRAFRSDVRRLLAQGQTDQDHHSTT